MGGGLEERGGGAMGPKLLPGEMFSLEMLNSASSLQESSFQGLVLRCCGTT